MAIEPIHEDRVVRYGCVDQLMSGQHCRIPAFVVPIAAGDPLAGRLFGSKGSEGVAELCLRLRVAKLGAAQGSAARKEMTCASLNPGSTRLPCRSILRVPLWASLRISLVLPTATMRSAAIA